MENTNKKSFWRRPEGITGMIPIVLVIGILAYFSASIAPFMLLALQGGIYTIEFAAGAGVLCWVATSKDLRVAVTAWYQVTMKKITAIAIEMDPLVIIKGHLKKLEGNIEDMDSSIDVVTGENKKIQITMAKNQDEMIHLMETATIAKNKMEHSAPGTIEYVEFKSKATLDSNQVGRLQKSNAKYSDMLNRGKSLENILERQLAAAKFVLADMTAEVKIQETDYKMINATYNAFESARKVIAGNPDEQALYLQTMEFMADNLGEKVGKIDRFMKNTSGILTNMDIENEAFTTKGMRMIDDWSSMGEDMFITSPKEDLKLTSVNPSNTILPKNPDVVLSKNKSKYLN